MLRDGGTAHLRPIRPDDGDLLRRFYARLSDETIHHRFSRDHDVVEFGGLWLVVTPSGRDAG